MSENVNFYQGSKENYNPSEMQGGLYFSKDSKEILLNGESYGNATPADEEDITAESGNLKLRDRAYDADNFSGKGYKILRKNIVEGKNILTQDMINEANTVYEIRYDFDLNGATITIPEGCVLKFEGGTFKNGVITTAYDMSIFGYGFQCTFADKYSMNRTHFNSPYHVDNSRTDDYNPDGSQRYPFKSINSIINICNNIRLHAGNIYWIDEVAYTNTTSIITLFGNTTIKKYGEGPNPVISGRLYFPDLVYNSEQLTIDLSQSNMSNVPGVTSNGSSSVNIESLQVSNVVNDSIFNFGMLYDNVGKRFTTLLYSLDNIEELEFNPNNVAYYPELQEFQQSIEGTSSVSTLPKELFLTIKGGQASIQYKKFMSAGLNGIYCDSNALHIEDVNFEYLGRHGIGGGGKASIYAKNCNFYAIGGSIQNVKNPNNNNQSYFTQYGNAIEVYATKSTIGIYVIGCTFNRIFDAAVTVQGQHFNTSRTSIVINNTFIACCYAVELFNYPNDDIQYDLDISVRGNKFINCYYEYSGWYHINAGIPANGVRTRCGGLVGHHFSLRAIIEGNLFFNSPVLGTTSQESIAEDVSVINYLGVWRNNLIYTNPTMPIISWYNSEWSIESHGVSYLRNYIDSIDQDNRGGYNQIIVGFSNDSWALIE